MKKYSIMVEKTATGFSAHSKKYPVVATGEDIAELAFNIIEALNFYFDEAGNKIVVTRKDIEFDFSIPSLFELYPINVRQFAKRIGMNYTLLAQYVQGRKKPSDKQVEKIVDGLQEVGRELSQVSVI